MLGLKGDTGDPSVKEGTEQTEADDLNGLEAPSHIDRSKGKIVMPSPSTPSDIWSLGCLLVEIITGEYLMIGRTWTDLYVSLCMPNFITPSLEDFKQTLSLATPSNSVIQVLEEVVLKCLKQDPKSRAKIVDIFEDIMTVIMDHSTVFSTPKSWSRSDSCSTHSRSSSHSISLGLNSRNESSVFLREMSNRNSKKVSRWSMQKSWNMLHWNHETTR